AENGDGPASPDFAAPDAIPSPPDRLLAFSTATGVDASKPEGNEWAAKSCSQPPVDAKGSPQAEGRTGSAAIVLNTPSRACTAACSSAEGACSICWLPSLPAWGALALNIGVGPPLPSPSSQSIAGLSSV